MNDISGHIREQASLYWTLYREEQVWNVVSSLGWNSKKFMVKPLTIELVKGRM